MSDNCSFEKHRWGRWLEPANYARWFGAGMGLIFAGGTLLLLLSAFTGMGGDIIVGDGREYFEYARSLMAEGRLPREHIRYPCGVSLIGLTLYAPSMWLARAAGWLETARAAGGWSLFNQMAFCLPLIALAGAGVTANLKMLDRLGFDRGLNRLGLLAWLLGTNVSYYIFKEPAMSESATYSLLSIYYYLLLEQGYHKPPESWRILPWAGVGLALGAAAIVRQQNALHGFALVLLVLGRGGRFARGRLAKGLRPLAISILPATAVALALFALPYLAWAAAEDGARVYAYGDERFNFLRPHLLAVLFQPRANGLFVWTPVFAVAALGWIPLFHRHRRLALPFLAAALSQYYLIASWWAYSFGTSVGHRGFFTILPLLLPGLVGALQGARATGWLRWLAALLLVLSAANVVLLLLVSSGRISVRID